MSTPYASDNRVAHLVGRALRLLLGLALVAVVVPVYVRVDGAFVLGTVLVVLGLIAAYALVDALLSRPGARVNRWLGAVMAVTPVTAVYVLGSPAGVLFGRGEGQLAALTFLSASLFVAAVRADPGCEVMSIPGMLLGRRSHLACLLFSPVDSIERAWRRKSEQGP